jgi:hypothetical protein
MVLITPLVKADIAFYLLLLSALNTLASRNPSHKPIGVQSRIDDFEK